MKIYVPNDSVFNKCYVVQNNGIIRGYDRVPSYNTDYYYRDYYIDNDYIYRDGYGTWGSYSSLPICLNSNELTNDYYYRLDFDKILFIFLVISIFGIFIPIKIFSKIFKKGAL